MNNKNTITIGIDARLWNETGVGRYIRCLFHNLSELDKDNEYVWFFRTKEFKTIEMPSPKWRKVKADVQWHTLAEQLILPWIFYKEKLDLLHFPYFSFPILYPGKFVITIHDLIFDYFKSGRASTLPKWLYIVKKTGYHFVLWVATKRAINIFTLSNFSKHEIAKHYKVSPEKIIVTYESGTLENATKEFTGVRFNEIKNMKPYLLYVGNAHPHKNVENLIFAMKKVQQYKKDIKLVLIGNDNFFYSRLKKFIHEQQMDSRVIIIGAVANSDLAGWYHSAQAFVTASKMEGFGIPPLEAMSIGCPVIVSDIPIFHEIYGNAAMYFDQTDPENIADVIIKTLNNKLIMRELIRKGYEKANQYSWKKMTEETLKIYESSVCL